MARSSKKWEAGFLVVFFSVLFANLPMAEFMDREKPATWIQVLYGVAFFGFIFGNLPLLAWFYKRQQRRFQVTCPNCDKPLTGVSGQIVVATGNCGHCGERVLSDAHAAQ